MTMIIRKVPAKVGSQSLIGVGKNRPCSWGNYFDIHLVDDEHSRFDGIRVLNFWAENLEHLVKTGVLQDGMVQIYDFGRWCIIQDPRIPEEYYYNKCCFTGTASPPLEIAEQIYDILGDPTNELERFTNPVEYYAKRGSTYNPETGMVTHHVKADVRKLKATWNIGYIDDAAAVYAPYIPK